MLYLPLFFLLFLLTTGEKEKKQTSLFKMVTRKEKIHVHRCMYSLCIGSEHRDIAEDVPLHCRGSGLHELYRSHPTQTII